jgi:enediyne biosynthesis protein E3
MGRPMPAVGRLLPEPEPVASAPGRPGGPAAKRAASVRAAFRDGFLAVAERSGTGDLPAGYEGETADLLGFAFEGAGMALGLADLLDPPPERLRGQLEAPNFGFGTLVAIGAGWALARLRRPLDAGSLGVAAHWTPDLADGFGFFECLFHPRATLERRALPVTATWTADFDRGAGRAAWFLFAGSVEGIVAAFQPFPDARRAGLWTGAGFAAAYAGGVPAAGLRELATAAGPNLEDCRRGAALAVGVRTASRNPSAATDLAQRVFAITAP